MHQRHDTVAALGRVGPQRGQVARLRERGPERDVTLVLAVPVAEGMAADDPVLVVDERGRRHESRLQRRRVRVDLERRAHAPPSERVHAGEVDLAADRRVVVIRAADHRHDLAVRRAHRQERACVDAALGVCADARLHPPVGHRLCREVERRRDRQAAFVERLLAVTLLHILDDVVDEVRGDRVVGRPGRLVRRDHHRHELGREDLVRLAGGEVAHRREAVQDLPPSRLGRRDLVRRPERVVVARRLRDAGEERGLRPRELLGVDLEVRLGGGLGAVCAVAVVDRVQVQLEDLRLRVAAFHLLGQQELAELAADRAALRLLRVQDVVLDDLLRDRRAAERR